jgi:hypothetical protein
MMLKSGWESIGGILESSVGMMTGWMEEEEEIGIVVGSEKEGAGLRLGVDEGV